MVQVHAAQELMQMFTVNLFHQVVALMKFARQQAVQSQVGLSFTPFGQAQLQNFPPEWPDFILDLCPGATGAHLMGIAP